MFRKFNKVLFCGVFVGGSMTGNCMSCDIQWKNMDDVRKSCQEISFNQATLEKTIEKWVLNLDPYLAVALLCKAHSLISYQDEVSGQIFSSTIKSLVNQTISGDNSTYNERYAEVLWKSQTANNEGCTLKKGWVACIVQKAEALLESCNTENSHSLLNTIRTATYDL